MRKFSPGRCKQARGNRSVADVHRAMVKDGHDVSISSLYLWESGSMVPNSKYLAFLADFYGYPTDYFFVDTEQTDVCISKST